MIFRHSKEYLIKQGVEFELRSPNFPKGGRIPAKHTCDSEDLSPKLEWRNAPEGTKSYALIMYDPDAPIGTFVHWVLYNIPGNLMIIEEGVPKEREIPGLGLHGVNDFGFQGYGGPCPPRGHGEHRYYFALHATNVERFDLSPGVSATKVLNRIKNHVIGYAVLIGKYSR